MDTNEKIVSQRGQLTIHDLVNIAKNGLIFVAPQFLSQMQIQVNFHDLGSYTSIIGILLSGAIKLTEKFNTESVYKPNVVTKAIIPTITTQPNENNEEIL